ncbi:MAG: hypothetical protein NC113_09930 [Bacteroides sp.]|nr:hypothetical protein [Bacteroides sp.]MCM1448513.1 hypothetical protein [Bacteroides sp.]
MKRVFAILVFALLCGVPALAQSVSMSKYDVAPEVYEHIFLDHVQDFRSMLIDIDGGQYVGQVDGRHALYGYGQFINNEGHLVIGKFRRGGLLQGISLGKDNVTVGNKDHYCSYSLSSGRLEYIYDHGKAFTPDAAAVADYTFMTMTFANGDSYVGELYKGQRHGLGIYYYASGGLWYGGYVNGMRCGFGAWFKPGNDMLIGQWDGEDERRSIYIPLK